MAEFTALEEPSVEELRAYDAEQKRKRAEEQGAPLLEGLAFWVPPLTDVYLANSAYVWYQLVHEGFDLALEECGRHSIGEPQTWHEVYSEAGMDYVLMGSRMGLARFTFALENGIGVGQPFLLQIGPPHFYRCSYEYDEWDCDYDVEIVRVMPRAPLPAARSIERMFDIKKRVEEWRYLRAERLRVLQRTDISQMFIEKSNYYVNGGYYSDEIPTGCQVCICSRHNVWPPNPSKPGFGRTDMVYGRHPTSWEEALESLFVVAEQVLGFKKEQLQHLKQEWRR